MKELTLIYALKFLNLIGRYGTIIMPVGVVLGLSFPSLSQITKPLAEPLVLLMLGVSIYRLDPSLIFKTLKRFKVITIGIVWILIVMPFCIFGLTKLADLPVGLLIIVVAWSACPPLVSTPGLAILIGLDAATALLVMIGATVLFTVSLPIILLVLTGTGFDLDPITMSFQLIGIVCICGLTAQLARFLVGKSVAKSSEPAADGVIVLLMALFAVTIMGGVHEPWQNNPQKVIQFLIVAAAACIFSQSFCALIFSQFHRATAGSIALASGSRNLALLIPVANGTFADNLWLYLAVVQIPVYFLPLLAKPLYQKLYLK
ncbi:MAG: hypothetical protein CMM58_10345 [Rhodospirillaceae bacterium]|nr:hypothetical protein [Rhodospirillaceae bacterium]|tara:strand:+ start:551 stop:1501 length:951 start_codon:yes stop_codon:yes gene_type:complete